MSSERERVISISLTEAEWQAFVACQPSPVDWLRARILDEVGRQSRPPQHDLRLQRQVSRPIYT
jgi:hypothetical protein